MSTVALSNGMGLTPAMGFNTWNKFGCNIDEALLKETAQLLIDTGLKDKGYSYVNLDDCWMERNRTADGRLVEDPIKFPSGLKALGEYLHGLGFKFGIYSSAGYATCEKYPASLGMEELDAQTWANWGVDYLKYDNCYTDGTPPEMRYPPMRDALNGTGRPMLYSICEWGLNNPGGWAREVGNSWRTTPDIRDEWTSVMEIVEVNGRRWRYGRRGGWNDPDMLEVGNGGMSGEEYRSHMSLWCVMKAPLLIGCDLKGLEIGGEILNLLGNEEVLSVNQDALGRQARRVWSSALEGGRGGMEGMGVKSAIMVPCERTEEGEGDDVDAVFWAVEPAAEEVVKMKVDKGGVPTATAALDTRAREAEVVTLRLLAKDGGDADLSLCLAVADQGLDEKQGLEMGEEEEEEEGDVAAISRSMLLRGSAGGEEDKATTAKKAEVVSFPDTGMGVALEPCVCFPSSVSSSSAAATRQQWLRDGSMLMPVTAPHLCLSVVRSTLNILNTGIAIELVACNETREVQQWTIKEKTTTVVNERGKDIGKWGDQAGGLMTENMGEISPDFSQSSSSSSALPQLLINNWQQQCLAPETDAPPGAQEIWMGPLSDNAVVVLLFNRSPVANRISARWSDLGLVKGGREGGGGEDEKEKVIYDVRDLWARKTLSTEAVREGIMEWEVPGHGVALFKLTPVVV
ncbi:hypothetical protein VYU27_003138 [Nannochloropsis oceanica]